MIRADLDIGDRFVAMYTGAHGLANNLELILEAANILRDDRRVVFVLVGDGRVKADLVKRTVQLELPNVVFANSRPKSEVPNLLAATDVCIAVLKPIPMFDTTYPNKVFDYMAAGKPTVLAIDGQIRKVIESARGGTYVDPEDPAALAAVISEYAGDAQRVADDGQAARDYVVANFDRREQAISAETILLETVRAKAMTGRIDSSANDSESLENELDAPVSSVPSIIYLSNPRCCLYENVRRRRPRPTIPDRRQTWSGHDRGKMRLGTASNHGTLV
jgi:glycosyltransferase involved in cell wall biosynthesis